MKEAFADALAGVDTVFSSVEEALLSASLREIRKAPVPCEELLSASEGSYRLARGTREMLVRQAPAFEIQAPTSEVPVVVRIRGMNASAAEVSIPEARPLCAAIPTPVLSVSLANEAPCLVTTPVDAAPLESRELHTPDLIFPARRETVKSSAKERKVLRLASRDFASLLLAAVLLTLGTQYLLASAGLGPG